MLKKTILILILFTCIFAKGQNVDYIKEIKSFQDTLNKEFSTPEESPLTLVDQKTFEGLAYFPIDEKYRVEASFIRTPNEKPFKMATTTSRKPIYIKYGEAHFTIDNKQVVLEIYQNQNLKLKKGYENYLFLPFTDETNGGESYGGGRFIDLRIPNDNMIIIDFNKAYNPYCAYNYVYSCPKPPEENSIPLKINAGVKTYQH